jgi:hypothetical protein
MAKTKIVLNHQSDLILNNAQIVQPTGIVKSDLPGLVDDLDALNVALEAEEAARIAAVSDEETARIAADSGLSSEISVERGRIDAILDGSSVNLDQFKEVVDFVESIDLANDNALLSAVTSINSSLDAEEARAEAAEAALSADLAAEAAARIADVNAEETRAMAAEAALSSDLSDLQSYVDTTVDSAISTLTSDLADETTRAESAEASLQAAIDAEAAARIAADDELDGRIVDIISNTNAPIIDSFTEVVDNLNSEIARAEAAEAELAADLATETASRIADVTAEETRALAAEAALSADLADLQSYVDTTVDSAISTLTSDLADETAARIADVDAEEARAMAAEEALFNSKLNLAGGTMSGAIDMDGNNISNVNSIDSVSTTTDQLNSNTGNIEVGSNFNMGGNSITNLVAPTNNNDATNKGYVDAGDAELQTAIDTEKARIDAILDGSDVDLDQFAEVVAFVQSIDMTNDEALLNAVTAINADITAETSARIADVNAEETRALAAEAQLAADLAQEISDREAAIETEHQHHMALDAAVNSRIDQEILDRTADVNAEETRALAAESDLQDAIDSESNARTSADTALNSALTNEITRAIAAEGAIFNSLTEEITRATAAELTLTTDLATEVSDRTVAISAEEAARIAADDQLTTDLSTLQTYVDITVNQAITDLNTAIDAEETARVEADNTLRTDLDAEVTRATAAEVVLQSNIDTEKARIDAILDGSDVDLDQFAEIVAFVQSIDVNGDESLLAAVNTINQTIQQEVDRATQSENELASSFDDANNRLNTVESNLNDLPGVDEQTVEVGPNNVIRIKEFVSAPESGSRTFDGVLKMSSEPSEGVYFTELSLVTKQYVYGLFQTEANRAQSVENDLLISVDSAELRIDNLEAAFNGLPVTDGTSLYFDEVNNVIKLADSIEAGSEGIRTFGGLLNMSSEPSSDINFTDLSLVTKQYVYGLFQTEANRAQSVENDLLISVDSAELRIDNLETAFNGLPTPDGSSISFDENTNLIKLASTIEAGLNGYRTFDGVLKMSSEPSNNIEFDDLSLVTKQYAYGLFQTEASRAQGVENDLLISVDSAELRIDNLETAFNGLPLVDGTTLILDETNNVIKLGDTVAAGTDGVRTFEGLTKVAIEPSLDESFDDLTLVTRGWVTSQVGEDVTQLMADLAAEVAAREAAIAEEHAHHTATEAELQTAIDTEKARIDAILDGSDVDLNQFAEVVAFVQSIDMTNDEALLNAVTSINSSIDAEESRAMAAEASLSADLAAETASRIEDVNAEESRAMAAEAALSSDLADLQSYVDTTVDSAISTLTSDLSDETAARIADVDAEEARALAAESELADDLAAEVTRAEAAEAAIAADFANIYSKKVSVIESSNGTLTTFTLSKAVRLGSEMIYVNGLLMEEGEDYTTIITSGKVSGVEFISAPLSTMKVRAYGVCGL